MLEMKSAEVSAESAAKIMDGVRWKLRMNTSQQIRYLIVITRVGLFYEFEKK